MNFDEPLVYELNAGQVRKYDMVACSGTELTSWLIQAPETEVTLHGYDDNTDGTCTEFTTSFKLPPQYYRTTVRPKKGDGQLFLPTDGKLTTQQITGNPISHIAMALPYVGTEENPRIPEWPSELYGADWMWFEFTETGAHYSPKAKYCCTNEVGKMQLRVKPQAIIDSYGMNLQPFSWHAGQQMAMCGEAKRLKDREYDFTGLLGKLLHIVLGRPNWRKNPLSGSGYFCSAGMESLWRAIGLHITKYKSVKLNEPKDFLNEDIFERIA